MIITYIKSNYSNTYDIDHRPAVVINIDIKIRKSSNKSWGFYLECIDYIL